MKIRNLKILGALLLAMTCLLNACQGANSSKQQITRVTSANEATSELQASLTENATAVATLPNTNVKSSQAVENSAVTVTDQLADTKLSSFAGEENMSLITKGMLRLPRYDEPQQIHCVTSLSDLQRLNADLAAKYDEAFFEKQALILAVYQARSGSTQVEFSDLTVDGNNVSVSMKGTVNGMGTMDMAAFLVWAEVPAAYAAYNWSLADVGSDRQLAYK